MSTSKYPANDGWLKMTLTMVDKTPRSVEQLKQIASFGMPEKYEFAVVEQYGARVKVIYRHTRPAGAVRAEVAAGAEGTVQPFQRQFLALEPPLATFKGRRAEPTTEPGA